MTIVARGETRFRVANLPALVWPASLQPSAKRFRLFVAADTTHVPVHDISEFVRGALAKGMVYFCAWGRGCERFHDIVDAIVLEDELGPRQFAGPGPRDAILTTWHDHDSLEAALDFFARCAIPTKGLLEDSDCRLVVCVGGADWASMAERFLKAAPACRTAQEWCKTVADASERETGDGPPEEIVRRAKGLAGLMQPRRKRFLASLIFDSASHPALAGVRGSGTVTRQLLFESGDLVVDIALDASPGRDRILLVGQVMRKQDPYLNVPVALQSDSEQCVTFSNRFGEFQFETRPAAELSLVVMLPGSRVVEIPLHLSEAAEPS